MHHVTKNFYVGEKLIVVFACLLPALAENICLVLLCSIVFKSAVQFIFIYLQFNVSMLQILFTYLLTYSF